MRRCPRRKLGARLGFIPFFLMTWWLMACAPGALLTSVSLSQDRLSPNGDEQADSITISYRLSREATVSIVFADDAGKRFVFRDQEPRSAGDYVARFDGTYPPEVGSRSRRVLPDGRYQLTVVATDHQGRQEQDQRYLQVENADVHAPEIRDLVIFPTTISPNGDAQEDEALINYALTKDAWVETYVTNGQGTKYLLEPPTLKTAALQAHRWNGTSGKRLIPDGTYTLHVVAWDRAGNVTDATHPVTLEGGGTPRLEILSARFRPKALPVGGILQVELMVKNTGDTVLRTMGPPSGTPYDTESNFLQFKDPSGEPRYFERLGFWRVGVGWNLADRPFPVRWGLGKDLAPGEEAVITGTIKVLIPRTREVYFWASAVQEGVGFPGGQVGLTKIVLSY